MKYGSEFSASDERVRASGTSHNAAQRGYANLFALATQGGTAEALQIAAIGPGSVLDEVRIETDANLSTITFKIGTATDDDKYGTAVAGPNATVQIRYPLIGLGLTPTTERETILLTPSAVLPGAGTIRTKVTATHR